MPTPPGLSMDQWIDEIQQYQFHFGGLGVEDQLPHEWDWDENRAREADDEADDEDGGDDEVADTIHAGRVQTNEDIEQNNLGGEGGGMEYHGGEEEEEEEVMVVVVAIEQAGAEAQNNNDDDVEDDDGLEEEMATVAQDAETHIIDSGDETEDDFSGPLSVLRKLELGGEDTPTPEIRSALGRIFSASDLEDMIGQHRTSGPDEGNAEPQYELDSEGEGFIEDPRKAQPRPIKKPNKGRERAGSKLKGIENGGPP